MVKEGDGFDPWRVDNLKMPTRRPTRSCTKEVAEAMNAKGKDPK